MIKPISTKRLCKRKKVGIALAAPLILSVVSTIDPEELILVAMMGNIKFCHPHNRANNFNITIDGRYRHFSDLTFLIGAQM